MVSTDYSKDAPLSTVEIFDFDTQDAHETGINIDRMRLPKRYDISKYYERKASNAEQGNWENKTNTIDFSEDFNWQITYSFPSTMHPYRTHTGSKYGGKNVTYRRLYLILCEHFNDGKYFIDDYFNTVYPHTVKPEVDARLQSVKAELLAVADTVFSMAVATKRGTFDMRYKINRGMKEVLNQYESFAQDWEDSEGEYIARIIKEDIINCMMSGQLQLETSIASNTEKTKEARRKAGLSEEPTFFAMGNLIEHIQLFVKIGGNRQWKTSQGILV